MRLSDSFVRMRTHHQCQHQVFYYICSVCVSDGMPRHAYQHSCIFRKHGLQLPLFTNFSYGHIILNHDLVQRSRVGSKRTGVFGYFNMGARPGDKRFELGIACAFYRTMEVILICRNLCHGGESEYIHIYRKI